MFGKFKQDFLHTHKHSEEMAFWIFVFFYLSMTNSFFICYQFLVTYPHKTNILRGLLFCIVQIISKEGIRYIWFIGICLLPKRDYSEWICHDHSFSTLCIRNQLNFTKTYLPTWFVTPSRSNHFPTPPIQLFCRYHRHQLFKFISSKWLSPSRSSWISRTAA